MAFLKKEFTAIFKTYRFWVIPLVFVFFALMSAPAAKFTPDLLKSALPAGVKLHLPTPMLTDAFAQWFKNLSQIGVLAVILLTMGLMSEEKASGTILLIVTKPVSRAAVVLSKFFAQAAWLAVSFMAAAVICYLYAAALFKFDLAGAFAWGNLLYLGYFLLVVAITIFFSTVLKNQIAAGGLALITVSALSLVAAFSQTFDKYSPTGLTTVGMNVAFGKAGAAISQAAWPAATALVSVAVLLAAAILIFNRQEL
jgi:ABC-2 type transport system permease protein